MSNHTECASEMRAARQALNDKDADTARVLGELTKTRDELKATIARLRKSFDAPAHISKRTGRLKIESARMFRHLAAFDQGQVHALDWAIRLLRGERSTNGS